MTIKLYVVVSRWQVTATRMRASIGSDVRGVSTGGIWPKE